MKDLRIISLGVPGLDPRKIQAYSLLAPPKFRCCLKGKDPDGINFSEQIAIGIERHGVPVGLALSSFYRELGYADLHSVHLEPPYQTADILHALLTETEKVLLLQEAGGISFRFSASDPLAPALSTILQKNHWSVPKLSIVRYFYDAQTFSPPWYERPPKLPSGYKIGKWSAVKKQELKKIRKNYDQGHFSAHVSPFWQSETIEPINSIGLRYKNQIAGWMICHRIAHDTIRYTALYAEPRFSFTGYPIRLLVEAIKLQQASKVKWALFELNLQHVPTTWINFVSKRLAPFTQAQEEIYETWKQLR